MLKRSHIFQGFFPAEGKCEVEFAFPDLLAETLLEKQLHITLVIYYQYFHRSVNF
jgi:hypothetical protein